MNITIIKTDWCHHQAELKHIREEVFMREQNISVKDEWDNKDENAIHYLAYLNHQAIACARMISDSQEGKIGRVAVLHEFRRQKIATKLLEFILHDAKKSGLLALELDAQITATELYHKLGFTNKGETFLDAGIIHQKMSLSLLST